MEVGVADCHRQEAPHPVWGHAGLSHSEAGVASVDFDQAMTLRLTCAVLVTTKHHTAVLAAAAHRLIGI